MARAGPGPWSWLSARNNASQSSTRYSSFHSPPSRLACPPNNVKLATQQLKVELLESAWETARDHLDSQKIGGSHWTGELSTSALSTATAISGLVQMQQHGDLAALREPALEKAARRLVGGIAPQPPGTAVPHAVQHAIEQGCHWLAEHQNADGGFGDTNRSHSNIATTMLVLAAWKMAEFDFNVAPEVDAALRYVNKMGKWEGLRRRYGKDKTFVVPILSNCALAGMVPWKQVPRLPFEAAWLPQDWYRLAKMPVVSYAVPALVAIGQASFYHAPPRNPLMRWIRARARQPTLDVLRRMQPASGGYLEATPLTSFVLMNLANIGHADLPVARDCLRFLLDSMLADGSWPIDTNLATWVTNLAIVSRGRRQGLVVSSPRALAAISPEATTRVEPQTCVEPTTRRGCNDDETAADDLAAKMAWSDLPEEIDPAMVRWILACQHKSRHPFTGANPGGWGWTNLSGAVPDADDTPAAILALHSLDMSGPGLARLRHEVLSAIGGGLRWLYQLQNRDGGMPTFCRGWGQLPFDRSGTDLTAHALRAVHVCLPDLDAIRAASAGQVPTRHQLQRLTQRGLRYIERQQLDNGSWLPLWFGNQDRPEEDNPIYGTSKVLIAYAELGMQAAPAAQRAEHFLRKAQNADGGWGGGKSVQYPGFSDEMAASPAMRRFEGENGGSSIEETALALEALIQCGGHPQRDRTIMRALEWLCVRMRPQLLDTSLPIGFYFAKLWYHERLYPSIFSLAALGSAIRRSRETPPTPAG